MSIDLFPLISLNSMWQSRHKWHCVTNFSVTSGWYTLYHAVFAVTFDIIYSLSCLWRINFIQVTGQKYKNCYFRLKCYFCKCAEIKSWHIYVWSQHLCKRLESYHVILRPVFDYFDHFYVVIHVLYIGIPSAKALVNDVVMFYLKVRK